MPFFSIIIPTYNRAKEIGVTLESVINQTYKDYEIIVVDDFSNDGTEEFIKKLHIPNLIYVKNKRSKGASGARNTGSEVAKGEWLAFLDSDDSWEPNKLEESYKSIQTNQYKVYYSGYYKFHEGKRIDVFIGFSGNQLDSLYYKNIIKGFSMLIVRKDVFWSVDGLDEAFLSKQDLDLNMRLAKEHEFGYINLPLVYINSSSKNRISHDNFKRLDGWIKFFQKYSSEMPINARIFHSKCIFYKSFKMYKIGITLKFASIYLFNIIKRNYFMIIINKV